MNLCVNFTKKMSKRNAGCNGRATWWIGTAGVPYCEWCSSKYQMKVGGRYIPRGRIAPTRGKK